MFSPIFLPPSIRTVFTAPIARASGESSSKCSMTATLCGIVRLMPRMPSVSKACMAAPSLSGGTSKFRYRQLRPAEAKPASCITPVGFSATGWPNTPTSSA